MNASISYSFSPLCVPFSFHYRFRLVDTETLTAFDVVVQKKKWNGSLDQLVAKSFDLKEAPINENEDASWLSMLMKLFAVMDLAVFVAIGGSTVPIVISGASFVKKKVGGK